MIIPINTARLAIGTAQFGLNYGIVNAKGKVPKLEARKILNLAKESGLDTLDTAISYGDCEHLLGRIGIDGWKVISKLPPIREFRNSTEPNNSVLCSVKQSLVKLRIQQLYGLLLHHPLDLLEREGDSLYAQLLDLKDRGLVKKIGLSVYCPNELKALFKRFPIDIVQIPFNIFDQRFLSSGWLETMKNRGVEIHSRSVFLQGLLVTKNRSRPTQFHKWPYIWDAWDDWLREVNLTAIEACLSVVYSQTEIDRIVVGFDSLSQFDEVRSLTLDTSLKVPNQFGELPEYLINPSLWNIV